ncbi:MAG: hypothetical protein KAR17_17805, partial [Cyclobacteriaceae bacterium]|nr:hypothetical protein [Cyclobacteriaceae bacterium]
MKIKLRNLLVRCLLILILSISVTMTYAQNWKSNTNSFYLKNLSLELDRVYQEYKQSVETYAFERDILIREVLDNGSTVSLIRIM